MQTSKNIYIDASIKNSEKLKRYLEKNSTFNIKIISNNLNFWLSDQPDIDKKTLLIISYNHENNYIDYINLAKQFIPNLLCLMLINKKKGKYLFDLLESGVNGMAFENSPLCVISDCIDQVLNGGMPITSHLTKIIFENWMEKNMINSIFLQKLTMREKEVMTVLAKGYLYKEIAYQLKISMLTVKNHLKSIYRKIGVSNRSEAIVRFLGK